MRYENSNRLEAPQPEEGVSPRAGDDEDAVYGLDVDDSPDTVSARGSDDGGDHRHDSDELAELRAEKTRLAKELDKAEERLANERRRTQEQNRREAVREALLRHECTKPDEVFLMIAPDLVDGDGAVKAKLDGDLVDLDERIEALKTEVPVLFGSGGREKPSRAPEPFDPYQQAARELGSIRAP